MQGQDFTVQFGRLVAYRGTDLEVIVPDGVTTIGRRAFYMSKVTSVVLPESVTEIEQEAFLFAQLTHIEVGQNIKKIGADAFLCGTGVEKSLYPKVSISRFSKSDQPPVFRWFAEHSEASLYEPGVYRQNLAFIGRNLLKEFEYRRLYWDVLAENPDLLAAVFSNGCVSQKRIDSLLAHLVETKQFDKIAMVLQHSRRK